MATTSSLTKKNGAYQASVQRNMKVFSNLSLRLSSGRPEEYVEAAHSLTNWLTSEKAYYLEARGHIVAILEAARLPLVHASSLSLTQEFHISMCKSDVQRQAAAYTDLVRVVESHLQQFSEDNLKSRLEKVFSTIRPSKQTATSKPMLPSPNEQSGTIGTSQVPNGTGKMAPIQPIPAEKPVASKTIHELSQPSPLVLPPTPTELADSSASSATLSAQPGPSRQPVPPNPAPSANNMSAQSAKLASHSPGVPAPVPDPSAPRPTVAAKRHQYPSKFMQLAAIDLKSYKRVQGSTVTAVSGDASRNVTLQQHSPQPGAEAPVTRVSHGAEAPVTRVSHGATPQPDREQEHVAHSSDVVAVDVATPVPEATQQAECPTPEHPPPPDSPHNVQRQPLSVDTQFLPNYGHLPTPEPKSAEDMDISAINTPEPSSILHVRTQDGDKTNSSSTLVHPSSSTIASPSRELSDALPEAQSHGLGGKLSDDSAKQTIPEQEHINPSASPERKSVLQPRPLDLPPLPSGPVLDIAEDNVVMRETAQTTQTLDKATNAVPPPRVSSHTTPHPEARPQPPRQASAQVARDDIGRNEDVSNAAVGPSSNGKRTDHLTILAKHFLQVHNEEDQQQRVPHFVRNMEKIISSLPDDKVEEIVQVAKKARDGGQEEARKVADLTGQGGSHENSPTNPNIHPGPATSELGLDNTTGGLVASSHATKKRRRSQSPDQTASSEPPSTRPRMGDIVPAVAETGSEEASKNTLMVPAPTQQQPSPIVALQSEGPTLADASNLWPRAESIPAPTNVGEDGIADKENAIENAGVKQRQHSSPSAADSDNKETIPRQHLHQVVLNDRSVLGPLSYQPTTPFEIVAIIEGSPTYYVHELEIELDERQAAMVSRWNERYNNYDSTLPCIAVTLICARLAEVEAWSERNPGTNVEEATRNMQIEWPVGGGVWITLHQDNSTPASLPLSPPAKIKVHEPVDLSPNIGPRATKIRLTQTKDLSDFVFVIRAHLPTEAQLHELLEANRKRVAWRDTLSHLSVPFKFKSPITPKPAS